MAGEDLVVGVPMTALLQGLPAQEETDPERQLTTWEAPKTLGPLGLKSLAVILLMLLRMTHTEIEITVELVRELLRDQHPDLAHHPVSLGARGWDNQLWRLGDDLAVRLPWATESADELLLKEHTAAPADGQYAALSAASTSEKPASAAGPAARPRGPPAHAALRRLIATAQR
ncbi:hypothetical protein [Nonomuraea sp. KM90]|uniref:hypothetical protein n=1 Tax=Nonomuraea sp. KM90 TaxID=3457428 RepID=UPI003FCD03B6